MTSRPSSHSGGIVLIANESYMPDALSVNANLEVDFLVKVGRTDVRLIQVADRLDDERVRRREVDALLRAMEELHVSEGLVLTDDSEERIVLGGRTITVKAVYRWLLETGDTTLR
jgi:predicted AAA+ superfamily ATPase